MGLPVRFAAPDSQCQGWGRVNSGMPVRITLQPEKPSDSPKVQAFGITPASGIENRCALTGKALSFDVPVRVPSGSSALEIGQPGGRQD